MGNVTIVETPLFRCPNCGHKFRGVIKDVVGMPWLDCINFCPNCEYAILESEMEIIEDENQKA